MPVNAKKRAYADKLVSLIQENKSILAVECDNVGSKQMQQIRMSLRGEAEVLMGKNTTIRKVLKDFLAENPDHPIEALLPLVVGNTGFVFTNSDLTSIRDVILANKVPAPARVGAVAPSDVFVEPGPTGCDPGQTAWFQALNIPTKINRGQIEMISRVHLVQQGDKVGNSEAALLQKLALKPFTYGLIITNVYNEGEVFSPNVLDVTDADILQKLSFAAGTLAALCMEVGYPTKASVPHTINNAFKSLVAICLETDYTFPRAQKFADFLADPSNFVTAPAAGAAAGATGAKKEEEEEEEESVAGGGGLFADDDDDW